MQNNTSNIQNVEQWEWTLWRNAEEFMGYWVQREQVCSSSAVLVLEAVGVWIQYHVKVSSACIILAL